MLTVNTLSAFLFFKAFKNATQICVALWSQVDAQGYLNRLKAIPRDQLPSITAVSYDILKDTLQTYVDGYEWR